MDRPYRAVRTVARFWIWFFFRSIEVRRADRVPRTGPVLLAINHPNNLIDSLLVGAVLDRKQLVDERRAILKDLEAAKTAYLSATRGSSW